VLRTRYSSHTWPKHARGGLMASLEVKPLADRVVVQPLDESEQMRGGLYIPDTAKEKPSQGEVVAVGPGKISDEGARLEMDVKVGDKVLYGKYSGTDVTLDGNEYLILRESDILAIVP
jgi:chaperonin GroES